MKALFLSSDQMLRDPGSVVSKRHATYAERIGELHILLRGAGREERHGALTLHFVSCPKPLIPFAIARAARRIIKEHGVEIISAQDPFEYGLAASRAVRGTNAKLHIQVHTDLFSPWFSRTSLLNRIRIRIADRVLPKAAGIRVVSERIKRSLLERYGFGMPEPSVIPIGVSAEAPANAPLPPHRFTFALIAVGRLEREKRVSDILRALARVRARYPGTGLLVLGDGRERSALRAEAKRLGLRDAVVFLGVRVGARALMTGAHAFIQASAYEGYGLTLIEAALAGVPIVTTDVGVVGDILSPGKDALVCPVADVGCLAREISRLIEDNRLRKDLALHAKEATARHLVSTGGAVEQVAADLARLVDTV